MNPIIQQGLYYFGVLLIGILCVAFLQRGFFIPFLQVKMSQGKKILIKVRGKVRDFFVAGIIDEGFLVYKTGKEFKRISLADGGCAYSALGILWVDVDEEKNAIFKPDYTVVAGFDGIKHDHLYKRCLYRPSLQDDLRVLVIVSIIASVLCFCAVIAVLFMLNKQTAALSAIQTTVTQIDKGYIVGASAI